MEGRTVEVSNRKARVMAWVLGIALNEDEMVAPSIPCSWRTVCVCVSLSFVAVELRTRNGKRALYSDYLTGSSSLSCTAHQLATHVCRRPSDIILSVIR